MQCGIYVQITKAEIDFDRPENGWLKVDLSFDNQNYSFYPSHVPYDSISELVTALLKILDGYDKSLVRWNDEPVEHEFVFERVADQIEFRVCLINKSVVGKERKHVFMFNGVTHVVVWPFWKALRDMESRQSKEEYEKQWRAPFPAREIVELTKRVKELKSNVGRDKAA